MKNTRVIGLATMTAYVSRNVWVLERESAEEFLKRGSSLMSPNNPIIRADKAIIHKALDINSKVAYAATWLTVWDAVMIPSTIMKNMIAIVVPRPFSPDISDASAK